MAESSSKRQKEEENNGGATHTDRISSLPDSVLCHILSFLSTETCVRTMSLVSRRWLHLWKHLDVLDFYDDYHRLAADQPQFFQDFAVFVNAVLARRRSRDIRKMRLSCAYSPDDRFSVKSVDTWIRTAVGPRLEELHLALFSYNEHSPYLLLTMLATCTNLVSLSLCGGEIWVELRRSSAICLPSLKMLQLEFGFVDATHVNVLLSGCPILETLELSFSPSSLTTLRMPPSLKSLKLTVEDNVGAYLDIDGPANVGAYLEIDAPALKYLSLTKITFGDALRNFHKVDKAYLDVFPLPAETVSVDPLLNLLRALSRVKHLVLHRSTTKWLFGASVIDFPEFCHLVHLELILPIFDSRFLFRVLQQCPMLQALIIQDDKDPSSDSCGFVALALPESVPNCLISHLTFFHFKKYQQYYNQLQIVGYVLRNGLVLKTMLISGLSLDLKEKWDKYRILKQFSDIPRGSAICQLKFD